MTTQEYNIDFEVFYCDSEVFYFEVYACQMLDVDVELIWGWRNQGVLNLHQNQYSSAEHSYGRIYPVKQLLALGKQHNLLPQHIIEEMEADINRSDFSNETPFQEIQPVVKPVVTQPVMQVSTALSIDAKPSVNDIVETQFLGDVVCEELLRQTSGYPTLDRIYGPKGEGGFPSGKITTLSGSPGVGKSRLMLRIIANMVASDKRCFYCLTEETKGAFRQWADNVISQELIQKRLIKITDSTDPETFLYELDQFKPAFAIVDSMKMLDNMGKESVIKDFFIRMKKVIGRHGTHVILICQVTKDNKMAGSNLISHAGDVVVRVLHSEPVSLREYTRLSMEKTRIEEALNSSDFSAARRRAALQSFKTDVSNWYRDNYVPSFAHVFEFHVEKNRCGPSGGVALFRHTETGNVAAVESRSK